VIEKWSHQQWMQSLFDGICSVSEMVFGLLKSPLELSLLSLSGSWFDISASYTNTEVQCSTELKV